MPLNFYEWLHDIQVIHGDIDGVEDFYEPFYWIAWHPKLYPVFWSYCEHDLEGIRDVIVRNVGIRRIRPRISLK